MKLASRLTGLRSRPWNLLLVLSLLIVLTGSLFAEAPLLGDDENPFGAKPKETESVDSPPDTTVVNPPPPSEGTPASETSPPVTPADDDAFSDPVPSDSTTTDYPPRTETPARPEIEPMGGNFQPGPDDEFPPATRRQDPPTRRPGSDPAPPTREPGDDPRPDLRNEEFGPPAGSVADSPSGVGRGEESPDYARCRFAYAYKGSLGVFHLTQRGGTAHYRTPANQRFLSTLSPPLISNKWQTIDLPLCCKKFIYYVPEPGCGDPSILAWAFSRQPCGPNGYVALKYVGGRWHFHTWCRRDVICDTCFPPDPHPPTPPCIGHHHHCCHPCWNCCWPLWCCRPHHCGIVHPIYPPPCGVGPSPWQNAGPWQQGGGYGQPDQFGDDL